MDIQFLPIISVNISDQNCDIVMLYNKVYNSVFLVQLD